MDSQVRLGQFKPTAERGVTPTVEASWYVVKRLFFLTAIPWPSPLKAALLRRFGARVGRGVVIAPRVNITMPWKLRIGDHSWIGEEAYLLSLEPISIGANVCISQRAFLCTGNHDYTEPTFDYSGTPIDVGDGAWIGAQAFVGPGVEVGVDTVVTAGSVATSSLPQGMVCAGNPCEPVRERKFRG